MTSDCKLERRAGVASSRMVKRLLVHVQESLRLRAPTGACGIPYAQGTDNELPNSRIIWLFIGQMVRQVDKLNRAVIIYLSTVALAQPCKVPQDNVSLGGDGCNSTAVPF